MTGVVEEKCDLIAAFLINAYVLPIVLHGTTQTAATTSSDAWLCQQAL